MSLSLAGHIAKAALEIMYSQGKLSLLEYRIRLSAIEKVYSVGSGV